jgi:hypothetical protein
MENNMKTLKFAEHLVPLVLSGEKTSTWRLFDDKDLQVGDTIILINKVTGENFSKAEIVKVEEKALGHIVDEDFDGHEKFESTEAMFEAYRTYYGDRVTPETIVKMIDFKLIEGNAMETSTIRLGKYKHYKGDNYEVIGTAKYSETLEDMVVYKALYDSPEFGNNALWIRPLQMFVEEVEIDGIKKPRFEYLGK